jgi:hypothetical protein
MKKLIAAMAFAAAVFSLNVSNAQTTEAAKPAQATATAKTEWKEKDEFHKVIAQTFHPMEDGNYDPIRKRSSELYEKALAWQNAKAPAEYDNAKIASTLKQLTAETKRLDDAIKGGANDAAINEGLTKIHDTFHTIVGLCTPGHDDHEGHNHGGHDHSDPNHKH